MKIKNAVKKLVPNDFKYEPLTRTLLVFSIADIIFSPCVGIRWNIIPAMIDMNEVNDTPRMALCKAC
jgi:hypothetical protein